MTKITIRSTSKSPITKNLKLQNPQVCTPRNRKTNDAQQTILVGFGFSGKATESRLYSIERLQEREEAKKGVPWRRVWECKLGFLRGEGGEESLNRSANCGAVD